MGNLRGAASDEAAWALGIADTSGAGSGFQRAVIGAAADPEVGAGITHRALWIGVRQRDLTDQRRGELRRSAERDAVAARDRLTGLGTLDDQVALEFRQHRQNAEQHPAGRCAGVDAIHQRDQFGALVLDLLGDLQKMELGTSQPIKPPDHEDTSKNRSHWRLGHDSLVGSAVRE